MKKGFTLAEILLTLTIIGVIASLTIPTLVQNTNNNGNVTKLKQTYSTLSQAFQLLQVENGGDITPVFSSADNGATAMNAFATKLSVVKNCGTNTGCWYSSSFKFLNGTEILADLDGNWAGGFGKAILADGTMLLIRNYQSNCTSNSGIGPLANNTCGEIYVDINGSSGPNTIGRDFFYFWITKTGIYPYGSYSDGYSCGVGSNWATSEGCAAKVLQEGAINY